MLDPANDLLPHPSSPTNSSISSSDLDTESTGSFFHDRSTTLGTLMGVTFRAPSQRRRDLTPAAISGVGGISRRRRNNSAVVERRRRWWSLCRDGDDDLGIGIGAEAEARPSSLGEFLEVERRSSDGGGGERALFADGRVLPPATAMELRDSSSSGTDSPDLCRFPIMITGICSGCVR